MPVKGRRPPRGSAAGAETLTDLCQEISEHLCDRIVHPDDVSRSFIPNDAILQVWIYGSNSLSRSRWQRFAGCISWMRQAEGHLPQLYQHYGKIFSILVMIGWQDWDRFVSMFHPYDEASMVCDKHLPLESHQLQGRLGTKIHARRFATEQSLFQARIIEWGAELELDRRERLPFTNMTMRPRQGAFANVHDAHIAGHHYQGRDQTGVQTIVR